MKELQELLGNPGEDEEALKGLAREEEQSCQREIQDLQVGSC